MIELNSHIGSGWERYHIVIPFHSFLFIIIIRVLHIVMGLFWVILFHPFGFVIIRVFLLLLTISSFFLFPLFLYISLQERLRILILRLWNWKGNVCSCFGANRWLEWKKFKVEICHSILPLRVWLVFPCCYAITFLKRVLWTISTTSLIVLGHVTVASIEKQISGVFY